MPRSLYAAFDRFPTRKGASTHIARFAPALFEHCGGGLLYALGDAELPVRQIEGEVEILRYCAEIPNFLDRAVAFGLHLEWLLEQRGSQLQICHFRDPWSGVPILARQRGYATVYEVNALPSIELPCTFPAVAGRTLEKIRASEMFCLHSCDRIVTPSHTTAKLLLQLGIAQSKICVIPNGADLLAEQPRKEQAPERYLIYFGALQSWQGVEVLLRAFARLADLDDLHLVICGSARSRQARGYERLAERLGLSERMQWHWSLPTAELAAWLAHAQISVAPLRDCARNAVQGCAPLKILESMAAGVPVIASRLPPVAEIISDGGGLGDLVRAGSFLRQQGWAARALLLSASPRLSDRRILGEIQSAQVPPELAQNIDQFRRWLSERLAQQRPDLICVDSFPADILGELCELPELAGIRLWHLARLLHWPRYCARLRGRPPQFERSLRLEPLHPPHEAFLQAHSGVLEDYQLVDSPSATSCKSEKPRPPFWLVLHSGPTSEVEQLLDYALQMRQIEGRSLPIVVATAQPISSLPPACTWVDQHPVTALIASAERIVSAAGFNLMRETQAFRHKQVVIPFWRRYDDQFERARRARPMLWQWEPGRQRWSPQSGEHCHLRWN